MEFHVLIRHTMSLALLTSLLTSCGGDSPKEQVPARSTLLRPEQFAETAPPTFQVLIETSEGDFLIEAHRDWAPHGTDRFYNLVLAGYYDDTRIYRVVENFVAQFGLSGDPYINQAWKSQFIIDDPVVQTNSRGTVTFAKAGLHTRTTEVFINYRDNNMLDSDGFAPFGKVIKGMEIIDSFYATYGDGPPRGAGPYAAMAQARGNEYLDMDFPKLTRIIRARILLPSK